MRKKELKQIQQFIKDNKAELKEKGLKLHDDHPLPQSRRDLFAMGFYTAGFTAVMPSLGSLLFAAKEARAQDGECPARPLPSGVPFFQVHAAGGWLTRDIIHGLKGNGEDDFGNHEKPGGGSTVNDYYQWGLVAENHPSARAPVKFGGHLMPHHSAILLAAMDYYQTDDLSTTPLNGKFNLFSFNHRSPDDSRDTLQNYLANASLLRQEGGDFPIVATGEGTNLSGLGAAHAFSMQRNAAVVRGNDISNLVRTGDLPADLAPKFIQQISNVISQKLSSSEAQKIMGCSTSEAVKLVERYSQAFDPSVDFPAIGTAIPNQALATITGMMFSGLCSAAGTTLGGYDYHGNGAQSQQDDNFALWRNTIIPVADAAIASGKPIVMAITSDGSVRCSVSETPVTTTITDAQGNAMAYDFVASDGVGDFGRNGTTLLMAVGDLPQETIKYHQIGHALAGGGVARTGNLIGYDQVAAASCIVETVRRLMIHMNPENPAQGTFEEATGMRLAGNLEDFVAIKDKV